MPRIVLTNDDGIESPGILALYQACEGLGERVVVAPAGPRSGASHTVTTHTPISVKPLPNEWYAVRGMPADCSRLALTRIAPDAVWVFSGINRGGNLGADVYISGTVAAAREAVYLGCRAIAISQYIRSDLQLDWEWTARQSTAVIRLLMQRPLPPRTFWNVNLPHLPPGADEPEVVVCDLDPGPLDVRFRFDGCGTNGEAEWLAHYEGTYTRRKRHAGSDVDVCFSGRIAVTALSLDFRIQDSAP